MAQKPHLAPVDFKIRVAITLLIATLLVGIYFYFVKGLTNLYRVPDAPSSGVILDQAHVLSSQQEDELNALIENYNDQTDKARIAIITYSDDRGKTLDYATRVGQAWHVSDEGKENGVVIALEVGTQNAGIAVANGAGEYISDDEATHIIDTDLLPAYSNNDYAGSLTTAINDIYHETPGTTPSSILPSSSNDQSLGKLWSKYGSTILWTAWIAYLVFGIYYTVKILGRFYQRRIYNEEIEEGLSENPNLHVTSQVKSAYHQYRTKTDAINPYELTIQSYNRRALENGKRTGNTYTLIMHDFVAWYAYYQENPTLYSERLMFFKPPTFTGTSSSSSAGGTALYQDSSSSSGGDTGGFDGGGGGSD